MLLNCSDAVHFAPQEILPLGLVESEAEVGQQEQALAAWPEAKFWENVWEKMSANMAQQPSLDSAAAPALEEPWTVVNCRD